MELNKDQANALKHVGIFLENRNERVFSIMGSAGTGKSHLIKAIKEKYPDILVHATTNQASSLIGGRTIHNRLGFGINSYQEYPSKLVTSNPILIDEASMLPEYIMDKLISEYNNKVILVGDNNQLTVGKTVDMSIYNYCELTINMRAKSESLKKLAEDLSYGVETGEIPDLKKHVGEHLVVIKDFKQFIDMIKGCDKQHEVLCYRNNIVDKYNELTGKGMTVHKAQGKTYDTIFVDHKDIHNALTQTKTQWNNPISLDTYLRLIFVAYTRAQHQIYVFYGDSRRIT